MESLLLNGELEQAKFYAKASHKESDKALWQGIGLYMMQRNYRQAIANVDLLISDNILTHEIAGQFKDQLMNLLEDTILKCYSVIHSRDLPNDGFIQKYHQHVTLREDGYVEIDYRSSGDTENKVSMDVLASKLAPIVSQPLF